MAIEAGLELSPDIVDRLHGLVVVERKPFILNHPGRVLNPLKRVVHQLLGTKHRRELLYSTYLLGLNCVDV